MPNSRPAFERTATHSKRRPAGHYCAYCGRKCSDDDQTTHDAGVRARTFCDADCERSWNIDASNTPARP